MKLSRRTFCKLLLGGGLATALAAPPASLAYVLLGEPWWLEVTHLDIPVFGLPPILDGLTIAHLSDFHHSAVVPLEYVRRAVDTANSLDADLMLLTGDYVTRSAGYIAPAAAELGRLHAPRGVYATLGNHDHWVDGPAVAAALSSVGVRVLRNRSHPITGSDDSVWLVGVDDIWVDADDLPAALADVPPHAPRILLIHNADFMERPDVQAQRFDLVLAGHTHGGQVRLPGLGALVVPSRYGQKYAGGLVSLPNTPVYVSRGIGLIAPPVRFLCRPEIALIRLVAASRQPATAMAATLQSLPGCRRGACGRGSGDRARRAPATAPG